MLRSLPEILAQKNAEPFHYVWVKYFTKPQISRDLNSTSPSDNFIESFQYIPVDTQTVKKEILKCDGPLDISRSLISLFKLSEIDIGKTSSVHFIN